MRSAASLRWVLRGFKHLCRSGFAGRASAADYPLANRFDEVDTLVVLDDVLVPWEDVFFYRHTRAATYIRGTRTSSSTTNVSISSNRLASG